MALKGAAAALCLCCLWSACRLRHGQLDAAAVRPLAAAAAAEEEEDAAAGAAPWSSPWQPRRPPPRPGWRGGGAFRNGTVVPHDYMVTLYHSLAGRRGEPPMPALATDGGAGDGRAADTVTGFADQAQPRGKESFARVLQFGRNNLRHESPNSSPGRSRRMRDRHTRANWDTKESNRTQIPAAPALKLTCRLRLKLTSWKAR
ncbi:hypothetical protein lerEdw1_019326 [Lerista edwardsae]|nr:hypothetical protein lerEdw1_019326 [Lerista edwardsae]